MTLDNNWFTETADGFGLSLKIRTRLHEEQSGYQRIEVFETESFGKLLTLDGLVMLTSRDNFVYHEMLSHPALFRHPAPRDVIVVGGGDCGTLREVLRHDGVRSATQIELDERVTRICEQFFPELCEANEDPRATLLFQDAIAWMQEAAPASADVILLDTTDPVGQASRLFGEAFYRDCFRVLREGGIIVAQSESPLFDLELLGEIRQGLHRAGYDSVQTLPFPQCTYPSGWWSATMAGKNIDVTMAEALRPCDVATRYYNTALHQGTLALPQFMLDELSRTAS